jgi:hypothetical protein
MEAEGTRAPGSGSRFPPANHSNNNKVTLVGGEAVTDGGGEGGEEEEATMGKGEELRRRCRSDLSPATG